MVLQGKSLDVAEKSSISESQHQEILSAAYNPQRLQQAAIITTISKTSTSTITTTTTATSKTSSTSTVTATTPNKDKNGKAKKDKRKYSLISMFFKSDKHAN